MRWQDDPIDLLCTLMDAGAIAFSTAALRNRHGDAVDYLMRIGALVPGQRPTVTTCIACDNAHSAQLEFNPATTSYFHFCPEVGRVAVLDADIEAIAVNPPWLIDWLTAQLHIQPPRRRELVLDHAWLLGEAIIRSTSVTVIFARGTLSFGDLDTVAARLPPVPKDSVGLVITTRGNMPLQVALPHRYVFLDLREIARAGTAGLSLDEPRIAGWIKGIRQGTRQRVKDGAGRPSEKDLIIEIYRMRRKRGEPVISQAAEARAISAEIQSQDLDRTSPAVKTIMRHLSSLGVE